MVTTLVPMTLADLAARKIPPQEWLVEDLIPMGSLSILHAREKAGKGLLAIDLTASVAEGVPFLGLETIQGKALYLAAEESLVELKSRIETRISNQQLDSFFLVYLDGSTEGTLDLTIPSDAQILEELVSSMDLDLLVLDVLRELHSAKEDSSDEMSVVMKRLRNIAHNTGCAVMLTHHQGKSGQFRGSTSITGGVDVVLGMSTESTQDRIAGTLTAKGRGVPPIELSISFDRNNLGKWTAVSSAVPKDASRRTSVDLLVESLNSSECSLSVNDLTEATGLKRQTVANAMSKVKRDYPHFLNETPGTGTGSAPSYLINREHVPQRYAHLS